MPKHRYYYYNHEACSFEEVKPRRTSRYVQWAAGTLGVAVLLAVFLTWGLDYTVGTPQELALEAENKALQQQLSQADTYLEKFAHRLDELSVSDQQLYRTLLDAKPISKDVRQVGVGGVDPYEEYNGFSGNTSTLLQRTSQQIDEIERRIRLQNESYRDLSQLAERRQAWMAHMPAILPANGPVVSGYGMRRHPILRVQKMHYGIDVLVRTGSPVVATGDGIVKQTGHGGGYGKFIEIEHLATGYTSLYAHLSEIPDRIRRGANVRRGEVIGLSGNTGRSSGPHLHYEVRDKNGHTIDPVHLVAPSMTPQKYRELLRQTRASTTSLD